MVAAIASKAIGRNPVWVRVPPAAFPTKKFHNPDRQLSVPRSRRWTDQQMIDAVESSASIRQVLIALGLNATGANYRSVHDAVARLQLDTSHWTGQGHLRGRSHNYSTRIPLSQICVPDSTYVNTSSLKKRLLQEGVVEEKCALCGVTHWRGEKLSLVLDHINGDNRDHRTENLRLLCPNCNSLQPTFAGRNKARRFKGPRRLETMQAAYSQNRRDKRTPEMRKAEYERAKQRRAVAEAAG